MVAARLATAWGLRFRVQGLGLKLSGSELGFRIYHLGFTVWDLGIRVEGSIQVGTGVEII